MQVKKLRQVYVVSADVGALVLFYQETLGLPLQFRDGDRWVQFQSGETSFALSSIDEGQGVPPGVPIPVFEVADLDAAISELAAARTVVGAVRDMGSHGRTVMLTDPAGTRLVMFQRATS